MIDTDPSQAQKDKRMHDFLNRINRELEYPTSIIQKLVVKNI